MGASVLINNNDYFSILKQVREQIINAQYRAVLGANREQIVLYWNIGKVIIENTKYGAKFVENLARDIKSEFPNAKGYSVRNLKYMRKFTELVTDEETVQTIPQTQAYQSDDVLVSNIRPYFRKIWFSDRNGGCSNDVLVLRANEGVYPGFLYYLLSEDSFFDYATATAKGTKMPARRQGSDYAV